jgi:SAM-dependent methyltransferase
VNARSLSARDPAGALIAWNEQYFRLVWPDGLENAQALVASATVARWQAEGRFVGTKVLPSAAWPAIPEAAGAAMILEHDPVAFPSYPVEWSDTMLLDAGALTLELCRDLLKEGLGLKDATPHNVLFSGSKPLFVDALSVEMRDPGDPIWRPYGQFMRTFVLPLLAARHLGWTCQQSFSRARDGIQVEEIHALLPWYMRAYPTVFSAVTGPMLLDRLVSSAWLHRSTAQRQSAERSAFVLERIVQRLEGTLRDLTPRHRRSAWTGYTKPDVHPPVYHSSRQALVARILEEHRPRSVLDVGTNEGAFARLAARHGADVVAIDRDPAIVDRAYMEAREAHASVLSLVVDLTDPTPASGWRNEERRSFLDRAGRGFDMVFCLAVIHHLVVGDGLSLKAVFDLLTTLARNVLVVEFVPPDDPLCVRIACGRPVSEGRWSLATFMREASRSFELISRHSTAVGAREIFVLRNRSH